MSPTPGDEKSRGLAEIPPVFEMSDIAKRFGATQALEAVSLTLRPGEIHGSKLSTTC